ncbi:MAG TPA: SurA N-terminal domain-containing protein [Kofleriaceae bacterium]|nr:SurA N-terminal domain-containing protein [Kofleriaceae bacterium]
MLESLRKQGASIVIYAVFGILIAVFVINFGAQSVGTSEGCRSSSSETVATVDGRDVGSTGWHWVNNFLSNFIKGINKDQRSQYALDWLVKRELLVQEAEARGLAVNDKLIDENLKAGHLYFGGADAEGLRGYFIDKHGYFVYDIDQIPANKRKDDDPPGLIQLVRQLGLTIGGFKEQQRKETLAAMMMQMLEGEARASKDEALTRFVFEGTTVTYDYVAFQPSAYRDALRPTDQEIDAWGAAHAKEITAKYEADADRWKKLPPQVRLRQIFVAKKVAPAGSPVADDSAAKLKAAKADIEAKKKSFADAAKELDSDEGARANGGDLGWRQTDAPALGDPKQVEAIAKLEPGKLSDVVTTDDGSYLYMVEAKRQGPLEQKQVQHELAEELAKDAWADEAAKRASLAALDAAKASQKGLSELYPRAEEDDRGQLMQLIEQLNDPNTPPEVKEQIQKQLQEQMNRAAPPPPPDEAPPGTGTGTGTGSGSTGMITIEGPDVPAVWGADDQKPPAGAAGAAAPTGSLTRGGGPAPTTAPAPAAAGADAIKPTTDPLPKLDTVKLGFIHVSPRPRDAHATGDEKALLTELFDVLADKGYASRVFKIDGNYQIVQLLHKKTPEMEQFDKNVDDRVATLATERGNRLLTKWLHDRCKALKQKGKITYEPSLVQREGADGKMVQMAYDACMQFGPDEEEAAAVPVPVQ